jgi:hypothetical protein
MACSLHALLQPNPFANSKLAAYARTLLSLLPAVRNDSVTDKVRSIILLLMDDGAGRRRVEDGDEALSLRYIDFDVSRR